MPDNNNIPVDATNPASWNTIVTQIVEVDANTEPYKKKIDEAKRLGNQFSYGLLNAFDAIAIKGKSLESVFKSLALSLSSSILKSAFAPLQQGLATQFSGLFKGLLPFANGGVLRAGTPVPFASGGVISSPIAFPLSGGRTGIAGERGPEAIMPLTRGPDGRLGVAAQGGGGPSITINISTPDVESFARSQTQVAAMIARAASLGQRNL
jgi:phage-related minor tail protein